MNSTSIYPLYSGCSSRLDAPRVGRPPHQEAISIYLYSYEYDTDCLHTKGTRAHMHRELIREWLWEPKGSSLEYI